MTQAKSQRTCMSAEQRAQLWQRWRAGEPVKQIATALRRPAGTIQMHIYHRGGCAPAVRRRRSEALSLHEREEISRGLCAQSTMCQIAQALHRAPSTISREVARHGGIRDYRASVADQQAWQSASRPKPCKLALHRALREQVQRKLALLWSPEQISLYLARRFKTNNSRRVSHETIYKSLFIQARGALRRELTAYLRTQRRSRKARRGSAGQGQILQALSIRERPAEARDRAVPGHWEGDLLCGSKSTQIATLVERHSRFVLLIKLPAKDTTTVVNALSAQMRKLPAQLRRSLTWDRGLEMAEHARFTLATKMPVYFCDPRSPWQRGSNENTNGLLRQYFPKGTDLSVPSQRDLNEVAHRLNTRPRKTLGSRTPADKLNDTVATTG